MAPIINPMIFYWMGVADEIKITSAIALICIAIFLAFYIPMMHIDLNRALGGGKDNLSKRITKTTKALLIALAVLALVVIIVPGKETMLKILIAKYATYDNAALTVGAIKSTVDYIIEALQKVAG